MLQQCPAGWPAKRPDCVVFHCAVHRNLDGIAWTDRLILCGIELGNAGLRICRDREPTTATRRSAMSNKRWSMSTSTAR